MLHVPFFRRELAHRLRSCAARRQQACACVPSGDDLKVIALLDRLSREAEHVSQDVVDGVARRCTDPAFAQRFETTWDSLDDVVGTLLVPGDATDLVLWMVDQADFCSGSDNEPDHAWDGRISSGRSRVTRPKRDTGRVSGGP